MSWGVYTNGSDVHVIPMDDWIEHRYDDCLCEPEVIYIDPDTGVPWPAGGAKVNHNALDERED